MKRIILLFSVMLINVIAFPQSKTHFNEKEFAKKYFEAEDFLLYKEYGKALELLKGLHKMSPDNCNISFKIGVCYINMFHKEQEALPFLQKAVVKVSTKYSGDYYENCSPVFTYFYLGKAYHACGKIDEAIESHNKFKEFLTKRNTQLIKDVNTQLEDCYNAKKFMANPLKVVYTNMGEVINTKYDEYYPVVSGDEKTLVFTSRRTGSTGALKDNSGRYFEDIYISKYETNKWNTPIGISSNINTNNNEASVGLSYDGNILFILSQAKGDDNVSQCLYKDGIWTKPELLPKQINSNKHETHASLSSDGKTIYFTSNRKGGYGGSDIYKSTQTTDGRWSDAINLGIEINTISDEDLPFIVKDNSVLFFSSKGHESMGGYDIMKSDLSEDGFWSVATNLSYPINSTLDDVSFCPSQDANYLYLTSDKRKDSKGRMDIYKVKINDPGALFAMLKGNVFDPILFKKVSAMIKVIDNKSNEVVSYVASDKETGNYKVSLPPNADYKLTVESDEHETVTQNIEIKEEDRGKVVVNNIVLEKVTLTEEVEFKKDNYKVGEKVVLNNIYFDFDKSTLTSSSLKELSRLTNLLNKVQEMKIEVSGHTDYTGSKEYNKKLSKARAEKVYNYLIEHGVSADRLSYQGYGFSQPVETNLTELGRKANRRTEFKITSMGIEEKAE